MASNALLRSWPWVAASYRVIPLRQNAGRRDGRTQVRPESLHFLQIWIQPRERGLAPSYTEWRPTAAQANALKVLVISPDGRDGSATIHQDADIYRIRLKPGETVTHKLKQGRGAWLHIAEGGLKSNGVELVTGDAACTEVPGRLTLAASKISEALLFDIA